MAGDKILIEHIREAFNKLGHSIADGAAPVWEKTIEKSGLGQLPQGYSRKIHGPYNPAVYYGKAHTHFADVKVIQLPGWLLQRSYNPINMWRVLSRGYHKWLQHSYLPKTATLQWPIQFAVGSMTFSYLLNYYQHHACHKRYKHRW
jgi:hypothetical protein